MPRKAFLKNKSLLDRFKDDYATHTGYIQSARAEHTWNNPLTRRKRTKELNRWIKSFAGKDHIHKLARFNATNAGRYESMYNEAMSLKGFLENLTEKLTKQFNLDAEKVQAYLDSHTQEMQELLDDKDLSLKEKVLFVRSEITGEKDEKKSESISVQSLIIPTNDDTWADVPDDYYPEQVACDICDGKYDDVVMHVVNSNILHKSFVVCDDCVSVAKEILEKEEHKLNKGRGYESKKSEGFALNFPVVVYKGDAENAEKAAKYLWKKIPQVKSAYFACEVKPKDGNNFCRVYLTGPKTFATQMFMTYRDMFNSEFWNDCDASPDGWVDPQTIARYDVATPRQESNETDEKLGYEKGHKNSRGEDAPWVIRSHEDNRVLASFATEKEAKEHLKRMKQYSKSESKKPTNEMIGNKKWVIRIKRLGKNYYVCSSSFRVNKAFRYPSLGGPFVCSDWDITEKDIAKYDNYNDAKKAWDSMAQVIRGLQFYKEGEDYEIVQVNFSMMSESKKSEDLETYACFIDFETEDDAKKGMEIVKGWNPLRDGTAVVVDGIGENAANILWKDWLDQCIKSGLDIMDNGEVYKEEPSCIYSESKKSEALFNKTEMENVAIKAAVKAAWSAAKVKYFRIDFRNTHPGELNVYPVTSDGKDVGPFWGVSADKSIVYQYSPAWDDSGKDEVVREMKFKNVDGIEEIFTDEFTAMDDTLEVSIENGGDDITSIDPSDVKGESKKSESLADNPSDIHTQLSNLSKQDKIITFLNDVDGPVIYMDASKGSIPYGDYLLKYLGIDSSAMMISGATVYNVEDIESYDTLNGLSSSFVDSQKNKGINKVCKITTKYLTKPKKSEDANDNEADKLYIIQGTDSFTNFTDDYTQEELHRLKTSKWTDADYKKMVGLLFSQDHTISDDEQETLYSDIDRSTEIGTKEELLAMNYPEDLFESKKSEDANDVTYELTEDAVTDLIKELGLEIVNTWYDGNKDRIVYDCKDKGDENGETVCVWVEPPYEARVWLKDVNPRVNQLVEDIETIDALKAALVDIFKIELGESHITESLRKPEDTIIVPNWLWETYTLGENYDGDTLTDDEQQTYLDFKEKYEGFSLKAVSEKTTFRSDNDFDSNGCPCYEVNVFKK